MLRGKRINKKKTRGIEKRCREMLRQDLKELSKKLVRKKWLAVTNLL
jgi:hypothetical protein